MNRREFFAMSAAAAATSALPGIASSGEVSALASGTLVDGLVAAVAIPTDGWFDIILDIDRTAQTVELQVRPLA